MAGGELSNRYIVRKNRGREVQQLSCLCLYTICPNPMLCGLKKDRECGLQMFPVKAKQMMAPKAGGQVCAAYIFFG